MKLGMPWRSCSAARYAARAEELAVSSRGEESCVSSPIDPCLCNGRSSQYSLPKGNSQEMAKVTGKKGVETVMQQGVCVGGYAVGEQLACSAVMVCHPKRQY